jgi:hypothetical protein
VILDIQEGDESFADVLQEHAVSAPSPAPATASSRYCSNLFYRFQFNEGDTRARIHCTSVRFAFKFAPTYRWVLDSSTKISPQRKENFAPRPPAHIIDSSTTITCNMSDTYSEAEERIEQALDDSEMQALESAPVIVRTGYPVASR